MIGSVAFRLRSRVRLTQVSGIIPLGLLILLAPQAFGQLALVRNRVDTSQPQFRVTSVEVNADIRGQVAAVQMAQTFQNVSGRTLETQFLFPLPEEASVTELTLIVDGKELPGELKRKEQARSEYEAIVRSQKDPALLEYIERGLFRTSVFPIPAGQTRRVELRYQQLLKSESGVVDFSLPLGQVKHSSKTIEKLSVAVRMKTDEELKNVYSPTHDIEIDRPSDRRATCRMTLANVREPNDLRLLFSSRKGDVGMSLLSFLPEDEQQGYFLLLASPRIKVKKNAVVPKSVIFVVDKSGSMAGEKLKQARASLNYMVKSLNEKDTFNIVSYSSEVDMFRPELESVSETSRKAALNYIEDIYSGGGTNIHGALIAALEQAQSRTRPTYVMFFTDGLPTVGETQENRIAAAVRSQNVAKARLFNFGVGYDVNSRLLDRLSRDQRGASVYVNPEEDIEVAAGNLFRKISTPAMTEVSVSFSADDKSESRRRVNRVYPANLPDLFRGEQLVAVGRYREPGSVTVQLQGHVNGKRKNLTFDGAFGDSKSTKRNGFLATLWATRRIGEIIDELDLNGQNQELVTELIDLSLKYGIMTPYTSFLADENTPVNDRRRLLSEAESRANDGLAVSSGYGGFVQREFKQSLQKADRVAAPMAESLLRQSNSSRYSITELDSAGSAGQRSGRQRQLGLSLLPTSEAAKQSTANSGSEGSAASGEQKSSAPLRRIGDKTFYWRRNEWRDAEVLAMDSELRDDQIVVVRQFSKEFFELAQRDNGRWSQILSLKDPVVFMLSGQVYRILPPEEK